MRALVLTALLMICLPAAAYTLPAAANTDTTRSEFLDALAAAKRGDLAGKQNELADLQSYPLYGYLTAADLSYRLSTAADAALDTRIAAFIAAQPDLPPAQRLRGRWLTSLADRGQWQQVIDNTQADDSTTAQCRALNARIQLGQSPVSDALALYTVGKSQPSTCDPVFDWLQNNGYVTADVVLQRARLAVLNGQFGLARYLEKQMPADQAATAEQWLNITQTPSNLAGASDQLEGDVAVYAFKRLALRDLDSAADLYPQLTARMPLTAAQRYEMQRYLALLYGQEHAPEALLWFARIEHARMADDDHGLGWEIRAAIYQKRWPLVIDDINNLPPKFRNAEEWQYWQARALAELGNKSAATAIFTPLAAKRSYYGYLAADALGQDYSLNERSLPDDPAALARLRARPALARAEELDALGMVYDANREWAQVIKGLDNAALAQAARIAYQWQWYSRAIITLAKADYWDDLDIRYPTPYVDTVDSAARANSLDPAYVFAIIRTESLFQPDARSPAGAIGLMQLLPATASHVARAMGEPAPASSTLDEPDVNVPLGSRYLRDMLNNWNGNLALATASYNAGPRKIAQWLPAQPMAADMWIANIPYTETRQYVERAMSHMTVFQSRLHESIVPLDKRLAPIQPSYADENSVSY